MAWCACIAATRAALHSALQIRLSQLFIRKLGEEKNLRLKFNEELVEFKVILLGDVIIS